MTLKACTRPFFAAAVICTSVALAACEDDPFGILNWSASPDTSLIYSLERPELTLPSAFNFALRRTIQIEEPDQTGEWDVVLDTRDGELVLLVPAFFGIDNDARVSVFEGMSFDQVLKAPEDTADYVSNEPIPMRLGNTYVIQTHIAPDQFGQRCHFFAKMQPTAIDVALGTLEFVHDRNPLCEDLDLIPPDGN